MTGVRFDPTNPQPLWDSNRLAKPTVRLGNTIEIKRPIPPGSSRLYTRGVLGTPQRIIDVNLSDLQTYQQGPGSWVLTLKAKITAQEVVPPEGAICAPLVAFLEFGAGGVTSTAQADAWRNVIGIPSETLRVSVAYEGIGSVSGDLAIPPNPIVPDRLPVKVEVTATLHRTLETSQATPRRSFWLLDANDQIVIPPFASQWQLFSRYAVGATLVDSPIATILQGGAVSDTVSLVGAAQVAEYTSDYIGAMLRTNCSRDLPPNADLFGWVNEGFEGQIYTAPILSFGLAL